MRTTLRKCDIGRVFCLVKTTFVIGQIFNMAETLDGVRLKVFKTFVCVADTGFQSWSCLNFFDVSIYLQECNS